MKRLVKLLTLVAVVAAVVAVLKRRPAPPSASPTAPPTPVAPKAPTVKPQMPTMPKMPTVTEAPAEPTAEAATWAEPTADGGCPEGYPVKAKASSKIFHVPGGVLYDKAVPDRCYATPEAAVADGFRRSLR